MQTYAAEVHELVRSYRRDEEHLKELEETLSSLVKGIFGDSVWIKAYSFLGDLTRLIYYSTTNLLGVQTAGEEYVGLVQVSDSENKIFPSYIRRLVFVLLESFESKAVQFLSWLLKYFTFVSNRTGNITLGAFITRVKNSLKVGDINTVHIAFFYLLGTEFYSLSKRIAGISYLSFHPQTNPQAKRLFRFVGLLSLIQISASLISHSLNLQKQREESREKPRETTQIADQSAALKNSILCEICLERKLPCSTTCGHLFCWDCLIEHSKNLDSTTTGFVGQCPRCRRQFPLSRVIPLLNFHSVSVRIIWDMLIKILHNYRMLL